jgi:circadian clock protein KaiC
MALRRVRTGILGLDEMLNGGFLEGDRVLVVGSAGTGKTNLGLQYLVNGATQFGENGIYLTFEELPDQIYRDAQSFGWDLRQMEKEDKFRLVCTSADLLLEAHEGEHVLDEPIKQIKARRIVVDSLSELQMYLKEKEVVRKEAYRLLIRFRTKGLTSMSTWETPQLLGDSLTLTDVGLSYVVDSIVLLKLVEIDSSMRKVIAILKMRGSDHDKRLREFEVTSKGIKLGAPLSKYEGVLTGTPKKAWTEKTAAAWSKTFEGKP